MKVNNWLWFFLFLGGLLGGTSVLLSAWGAHGLEDLFVASPRDRFSFNYATHFQLFHALFLPFCWVLSTLQQNCHAMRNEWEVPDQTISGGVDT